MNTNIWRGSALLATCGVVLAVVAGALTSCSCAIPVLLLGSVRDSVGNPVLDATVTLTSCCQDGMTCTFTTDWAGRWGIRIAWFENFDTNCTYTISKQGYTTANASFVAARGNNGCGDEIVVSTSDTLSP